MNKQKVTTDFANGFHIYVKLLLDYSKHSEERYVTDVNWYPKEFRYELGKPAYEFDSLNTAIEFCFGCNANMYNAVVVIAHEAIPNRNNEWIYKMDNTKWLKFDENGNEIKEEN